MLTTTMQAAGAPPASRCMVDNRNHVVQLATTTCKSCDCRTIKPVVVYNKYNNNKDGHFYRRKSYISSSGVTPKNTSKPNRWLLCQGDDMVSSDDYDDNDDDEEYKSSRNIAISLFRRYRIVIDRGGTDNLREFIRAGVNAYALGCTDDSLRKELNDMKESGIDIEVMYGGGGGGMKKSKIASEEVEECILWVSIIFITISCTPPPTVIRWSSTPPVVSHDTLVEWKGFCAIIANAYYLRGMAWLPVKTLQLEQLAVMGSAEEPSVVASRMSLAFSTLEVVSPQWPRV